MRLEAEANRDGKSHQCECESCDLQSQRKYITQQHLHTTQQAAAVGSHGKAGPAAAGFGKMSQRLRKAASVVDATHRQLIRAQFTLVADAS